MSETTVYVARKILTMNPRQPEATHLAVRDGRILAVGDLARMQAWGRHRLDTRFEGKVLMPGLVEGHCHLKEGGMWVFPYVGWFDRTGPDGRPHLLLNGELPNATQKTDFENTIKRHTMVHEQLSKFYSGFRRDAHPMAVDRKSVV